MDEHRLEFVGTVYVLPESRQFELQTTLHGAPVTLTGMVSQQMAAQFTGDAAPTIDPRQIALRPRRVEILTREIHERHRTPRRVHFLMRLLDADGTGGIKAPPSAAG